MLAVLRPILVTSAAAFRHVAGLMSPRRLAQDTILRSKHWPSGGIARQAFLAAASISAAVLVLAGLASPTKAIWS
jgi:hypothetical protein